MGKLLKVDIIVARLVVMCVFLPQHVQVFAVIGGSIYFVVRTIMERVKPPSRNYLWALALGSVYLLYAGGAFITPPPYQEVAFRLCERLSSFLLLPFVFAIMAQQFRLLIVSQSGYFVYGCIIVVVMGNLDFLYHHFIVNGGRSEISHVTYRMIVETFTGIHPTYMSMYLCFGLCIVMLGSAAVTRREVLIKYTTIYLLLLSLLALFSKSPLIGLVIISGHALYLNRREMYKLRLPAAVMLVLVTGAYFFIPFFRQRVMEIPRFLGFGARGSSADNSFYDRKMIFNTDMDMLRHYWLTGAGPGSVLHRLQERYFFHSIERQRAVGYFDPHNQYFSIWLSFGIAGILLFVALLAAHFVMAVRAKNYLYLYLLIVLCITFFTETLLLRQHGMIFYALFTSLFFFVSKTRTTGNR